MGRHRSQQGDPERRSCQCPRRRHPRRAVKTYRNGSRGFVLWAEPTPSGVRRPAHASWPCTDGGGSGANGVARTRVRQTNLAAVCCSRPAFPIALLAHVSGACTAAEPIAKAIRKLASINRIIVSSVFGTEKRAGSRRDPPERNATAHTETSPGAVWRGFPLGRLLADTCLFRQGLGHGPNNADCSDQGVGLSRKLHGNGNPRARKLPQGERRPKIGAGRATIASDT